MVQVIPHSPPSVGRRVHQSVIFRFLGRSLVLAMVAIGALSGPVGAAGDDGLIDDQSYESPNFGYEVEWGRPWDADPKETFSEDGFDVLALASDSSYIAIMGTTSDVTPEESLAGWIANDSERYHEIEIYEHDEEDGIAYATYAGEGDTSWIVVHVEIRELEEANKDEPAVHLISILFSPEEDFEGDFASAIDDVEIEGNPAFLTGYQRQDERSDDPDDRDDDQRDDRDDDREESARGRGGRASADGVIDDYTYESPSYGYEVAWDDPWRVDPTGTVSEPRSDELSLNNDVGGDLWIVSMPAIGDPEEVVDAMLDSVAQQLDDDDVTSFGEVDGVAYGAIVGEIGGETIVFYIEVRELADGALLLTNLTANEDDFDRHLLSAAEEVEIDGESIFLATEAVDENDERDRDSRDRDAEDDDDEDKDDRADDRSSDDKIKVNRDRLL